MDRLERLVDGRLLYRFKRPWPDGPLICFSYNPAGGLADVWLLYRAVSAIGRPATDQTLATRCELPER
ncbi:MAG: hypothetical protein DMG14_19745 [Acidobacteria bacterium]|nr:MAG: hypothetical protein DMG14_19745 [Acidobacteriota bacterium]